MKNTIIILTSAILLSGCFSSNEPKENFDELKDKVSNLEEQKANVEEISIPDLNDNEHYAYKNIGKKSPFSKSKTIAKSDIYPDFDRQKNPLQAFDLSSLSLKGIVSVKNQKLEALVLASDGKLYTTVEGEYMGKNHGKITNITTTEITLRELYKNEDGVWYKKIKTIDKK